MESKKVQTVKPEVKDEKKLKPEELKNTKGGGFWSGTNIYGSVGFGFNNPDNGNIG